MTDEEIQLVNAAKVVAETDSGKILLKHLSGFCYEKQNTFVCNPAQYGDGVNNAAIQNIRNGRRSVICHIRDLLEIDLNKPAPEPVKERDYI